MIAAMTSSQLLAAVSATLLLAAAPAAAQASASPAQEPVRVVVLGDSAASGNGDPTRLAWGGRYGRLLEAKLGREVVVTNLAAEGKSSTALLGELRSDPATRAAVRQADVVLVGSTAGAALNDADSQLEAKQCKPKACYASALRTWKREYAAAVAAVAALRGKNRTVLRGIGEPNVVPGAQDVVPPFLTVELGRHQAALIRDGVCAAMGARAGRCIDVLAAFNGRTGTRNAYASGLMNHAECCYPGAKGHQLIAQLLLRTGVGPLR